MFNEQPELNLQLGRGTLGAPLQTVDARPQEARGLEELVRALAADLQNNADGRGAVALGVQLDDALAHGLRVPVVGIFPVIVSHGL